jgi:hypothetical protein
MDTIFDWKRRFDFDLPPCDCAILDHGANIGELHLVNPTDGDRGTRHS